MTHIFVLSLTSLALASAGFAQVPVSKEFSSHTASTATVSKTSTTGLKKSVSPKAKSLKKESLQLQVAVVIDDEFPPLDKKLIDRTLIEATTSFEERFGVPSPNYVVSATISVGDFLKPVSGNLSKRCRQYLSRRYRGTGKQEFGPHKSKAMRFLRRWPLKSLAVFVEDKSSAATKDYNKLYAYLLQRYTQTVERLKKEKTFRGTPLVTPDASQNRSFAAWYCALSEQSSYDVVITNTFILADIMSEPHPHAFMGRAKVGGIAGPNEHRTALGGAALLATTFGIDTDIEWLSELSGTRASPQERAAMLGSYLLAHEVAHAIFGIPDMFDHPPQCLMTSRPNETYRQGLALLEKNPGICPRCRKWVKARSYLDKARDALKRNQPKTALRQLSRASSRTPKHFHGGYKKRMSQISYLVSRAYQSLSKTKRAKRFAKRAVELDPKSLEAQQLWRVLTSSVGAP